MDPHIITMLMVEAISVTDRPFRSQTVQEVTSKMGLYFDEIGTMLLYLTTWKVVTYINLESMHKLWKQIKTHQKKILDFCMRIKDKIWYHYTMCITSDQYTK
jgi:hypothetical protein